MRSVSAVTTTHTHARYSSSPVLVASVYMNDGKKRERDDEEEEENEQGTKKKKSRKNKLEKLRKKNKQSSAKRCGKCLKLSHYCLAPANCFAGAAFLRPKHCRHHTHHYPASITTTIDPQDSEGAG